MQHAVCPLRVTTGQRPSLPTFHSPALDPPFSASRVSSFPPFPHSPLAGNPPIGDTAPGALRQAEAPPGEHHERRLEMIARAFRPLLTILVTVLGLAFAASVFSPAARELIEDAVPVWEKTRPAEDKVREWLGLPARDRGLWPFD